MKKIYRDIILLEIILFTFPLLFLLFIIVTGVGHPDLFNMMIQTIFTPLILMGLLGLCLFVWRDYLEKVYRRAIHFLCFDYDKNPKNQRDWKWPINYMLFSSLYFFIFGVYFYFAGFKDIGQVIFLCWFGLMFLRLLHFIFRFETCKTYGKLLFSTFIPFGFLLEIGLIFFKDIKIMWVEFGIYAFFSFMFIVSTLLTEVLLVLVKDKIKDGLKYIWMY